MSEVTLWPGQHPGVHDHKPYDECPEDCPGRLAADTPYTIRIRKNEAGKAQLEATQEALAIAIKENGRIVAAIKAIHYPCQCDAPPVHCVECENFYWPCRTVRALQAGK